MARTDNENVRIAKPFGVECCFQDQDLKKDTKKVYF
jgi:hypothetical protein